MRRFRRFRRFRRVPGTQVWSYLSVAGEASPEDIRIQKGGTGWEGGGRESQGTSERQGGERRVKLPLKHDACTPESNCEFPNGPSPLPPSSLPSWVASSKAPCTLSVPPTRSIILDMAPPPLPLCPVPVRPHNHRLSS